MQYPFSKHESDHLKAASERPYDQVTLDKLDELSANDMFIHAETLRAQAEVALEEGYPHLAANLLRAAELTAVPNEDVLKLYDALRPERSSMDDLLRIAAWLESEYHATENAKFIREAAEVYKTRGLLRREA